MKTEESRLLDRLNDLVALDIDAVNAYEVAIARICDRDIAQRLRIFRRDHERHITELSTLVRELGGTPRTRPDTNGFLLKRFTSVATTMGDNGALLAMKANEHVANGMYAAALAQPWPPRLRALLERNLADERRHLVFIDEALRRTEPERIDSR